MGNLPFERNRYNPVRDTTPEEAERNKRRQAEQEAARRMLDLLKASDTPGGPLRN